MTQEQADSQSQTDQPDWAGNELFRTVQKSQLPARQIITAIKQQIQAWDQYYDPDRITSGCSHSEIRPKVKSSCHGRDLRSLRDNQMTKAHNRLLKMWVLIKCA